MMSAFDPWRTVFFKSLSEMAGKVGKEMWRF